MAPHPRMLYPWPPNTTLCLADCSLPCNFYHLCHAPPPPPPPKPSPLLDSATPIHLHHAPRLPLSLLLPSASLAAASLLFLLALLLFLHLRRRRRRLYNAAPLDPAGAGPQDAAFFPDLEADHHVWYIRTVGLDQPTIEAIAACVYKAGDCPLGSGGGGGDCAVCLAEFRDGELLRLLPKCGHAFHLPCIDTWLRSHVNCPLCRAPIVAPSAAAPSRRTSSPADAPEQEPNLRSLSAIESTHLGSNVEIDAVEVEAELGDGILSNPTANLPPPSSSSSRSSTLAQRPQPVRRSVSMNSLPLASVLGQAETHEGWLGKKNGASFESAQKTSMELESIEMEMSGSCSGSRFFLSKYGRARTFILPL